MSARVSFPTAYLQSFTKDGLVWADCVGCALLIYGYFISNRKNLWKVLLALGITGLFGTIIENFFQAKKLCCPDESYSFLLGMNELNWTVFETSCVVYSLVKLETTLTSVKVKRAVRFAMGQAHAYAYIFWFLADLLIFALLIYNTIIHMNNKKKSVSLLMNNLFKSSIPRFMIITINTLCLTIVSFSYSEVFVDSSIVQDPASVTSLQDLSDFLWALKGTYPLILLFDIHTTKSLIMMAAENEMDHVKLNKA
ncbi:hypothetical protein HDV06_000459 [Boothiomyces sp. JEL0866]|nr:hypothetical protein HDV06_000459 [Boothiomyces sp. JEL0866]